MDQHQPVTTPPPVTAPKVSSPTEGQSFVTTLLLSFFLGVFGADRLYLGYIGLGILKVITLGGIGIWVLIDLILLASGRLKDRLGRPLVGANSNTTAVAWILVGVWVLFILPLLVIVDLSAIKGLQQSAQQSSSNVAP
jgi:TM2 domain-containing membrane protein YozV